MLKILLKDDKDFQKAHDKYETFTSDKELRFQAISREKFLRDQLSREGVAYEKGELKEKHNVLIRLLELKYGLNEDERSLILSSSDFEKLDDALDAVVLSDNKKSVLKLL